MKEVTTELAPAAIGPYSQAVRTDALVFVSGQLPIDPQTGAFPEGGIAAQTTQSLKNLGSILKEAGSDYSKVIKTRFFLRIWLILWR